MQCQENNNIYAGFGVRFAAYMIDFLIIGTALLFVRIPVLISSLANPSTAFLKPLLFKFSAIDILIYLLGVLYYIIMTYNYGTTLGKKFFNIKVISADSDKLSFMNVLYRETIGKYLAGAIIFIGYFMIALDEEKRGLHDRLADTKVVYNFKAPINVIERKPGKKYAWVWNVKGEYIDEFVNIHLKPSDEIIEEQRKAGYKNCSVFRNGNQFIYSFECDNIDNANNYLYNSQVFKNWHETIAQRIEGSFILKKAELE